MVKTTLPKVQKTPMLTIFDSEYGKLNAAQKKAVDTIEGPVMVVAGPGTGKTQVVAMRVANILKKTHMRPANILCLTFSVSGATAMKDRLRLLIGADSYGVTVSTIHAFAASIIEQNSIVFDQWSAQKQITDIEKVKEMNTIIDQNLAQSDLLNPKDPYSRTSDILSRISQVKREGKSIQDLEAAADAYDDLMSTKSKPGTKVHQKNLLSAKKFRDFIELFRGYQQMMERTGRYDFEDMILHVVRALEEEDWLLASLQERYQYMLVDEFQDTNGAQYRLIELLSTAVSGNDPNLFVVGDDDQAIYRFQGANLQNMLSFHHRFPDAPVIPLTTSYRSTQPILDAASALIEKNEERLVGNIPGLQKILTSASDSKKVSPALLRVPSDLAEAWVIADVIEDRIAAGTPPEEIAVLTQTNHELFPLYEVLRARKIPTLLRGKDDLLSHSLVAQAVAILHAIEQPRSDAKISTALACDCFGIHSSDLGRLHAYSREKKQRVYDVICALPPENDVGLHDRPAVLAAAQQLISLETKKDFRTALETVEHVLRDCGLIPTVENPKDSTLDPRDLAALEAFFAFVKRQCLEHRACSLSDLLSDLRFYGDPLYSHIRLTYELPHLSISGVRLMTAHQSKGLEFDTVILSNFRDGHWDKRRKPVGIAIPEDLLFGWHKEKKAFEQHQDERRVTFVAMTRARKDLLMVCPRELTVGEKSRTISPSGFFAEMGTIEEKDLSPKDPAAASLLLHPKPKSIDAALRGYLEERLKTFALSPTSLSRFLRDPKEFLLVDLLMQPEHFDEGTLRRLGYGSAVHWALRTWATGVKEGKPVELSALIDAFDWYLRERTILTEKQREDLSTAGAKTLTRYFEQCLAPARPILHSIEREYRTHLGEVPIKGKIDRIDLHSLTSGRATIIDYKTGKAKAEGDIRGGLAEGQISRSSDGENFRQLTFYALLLEQADPLLEPQAFVLDFIGERGEDPIQRSFTVTAEEKDELRKVIKEVYSKILNLDFTQL